MRIAIAAIVCFSFIAPNTAFATDLDGVWTLPSGKTMRIKKSADGKAQAATKLTVGKRHVRLVFKGTVEYIKVGTTGGLGVSALARSFAIRHHGKQCVVKSPKLAVIGELKNAGKRKQYKASGYVSGYIFCGGENTWTRWAANVGGLWSAPASPVAAR
ncbi:MAG: hypothetical protein KC503_17720 [Myxococcales bacterium]|nr:hypothetical protein [Myxococcales bacterium]